MTHTTTDTPRIKIRLKPTEARRYATRQQRYAGRRACRDAGADTT